MRSTSKIYFAAGLVVAAIAGAAGCSVPSSSVKKAPPIIGGNKSSEKSLSINKEFGEFTPKTFTVFLWDNAVKGDQLVEKQRLVISSGDGLDRAGVAQGTLENEKSALDDLFSDQDCFGFAKKKKSDPLLAVIVVQWKEPQEEGDAQKIEVCKANQERRRVIAYELKPPLEAERKSQLEIFETAVGKENMRGISDPDNSLFKISIGEDKKVKVEMTIRDFLIMGSVYSTEDSVLRDARTGAGKEKTPVGKIVGADYDPESKVLTFYVPELAEFSETSNQVFVGGPEMMADDKRIAQTTGRYRFILERTSDFGPGVFNLARFRGDVKFTALQADGSMLERKGSCKIDSVLN